MSKAAMAAAAPQPQTIQSHRQSRQPTQAVIPALRDSQDVYPRFVWKDELDGSEPRWKRWFFWWVYRPFNQFCRFKLRIPSYNGEDRDGRLWYLDFLDVPTERWQAERLSEGRNAGYLRLKVNSPLPKKTSVDELMEVRYPHTDEKTQTKYRNGNSTMPVPKLEMVQLAAEIERNKPLLARHKPAT